MGIDQYQHLGGLIPQQRRQIARHGPIVGQGDFQQPATGNSGKDRIQRIAWLHDRQCLLRFEESGKQQSQQFIATIDGQDAFRRNTVNQPGHGAEIVGQGRWIAAQFGGADGVKRRADRRRRWIRILVGVELDDLRRVRLFTRRVALHRENIGSFK